MKRFQAIEPIILTLSALLVLTFSSDTLGQSLPNAPQEGAPNAQSSQGAGTYAPVGPSGYKVFIPEIKMNQIVGEVKPKVEEAPHPVEAPVEPENTEPVSPEKPGPVIQIPGPSELEDRQETPVTHLPFDYSDGKTIKQHEKEDLQDVKNRIEREQPHMGTPLAPINITEALPEPAKEALGRRQNLIAPKIKELEPIKGSLKAPAVEALEDHEALAPEDWIVLETRKEATEIPVEETKHESEIKKAQSEAPEFNETLSKESTGAVVENSGQTPVESPSQSTEKEQLPVKETQESAPGATENLTESIAPKEHIPSPLDEQVGTSRGLRIYLTETTPILEELSLLMTRAPSLNLEDYDPSEANTHVAVQDLNLKLESLKRDLRILDSKVFSIIPPSKYAQFHELIRQSISHTYLACESVSNYFQDAKPEDLRKVRDHLSKAKEFIELTRKRDNSG
ncbi:MAG: hypothetical protein WC647_17075 [Desulfomonilaceae bacterium]|jgi:hypothetical protein